MSLRVVMSTETDWLKVVKVKAGRASAMRTKGFWSGRWVFGVSAILGLVTAREAAAQTFLNLNTSYATGGLSAPLPNNIFGGSTVYGVAIHNDQGKTTGRAFAFVSALAPGGGTYNGPYGLAAWTATGSLDATFGGSGYITSTTPTNILTNSAWQFKAMCVDPVTDDIVIAGDVIGTGNSIPSQWVVARITPGTSGAAGALDTTFNPTGATPGVAVITTQSATGTNANLSNCRVLGGRGILLVGTDQNLYVSGTDTSNKLAVYKVNAAGALATGSGFGTSGVVEFTVTDGTTTLVVDGVSSHGGGSGDIYIGGTTALGTTAAAWMVALNATTGALDTNFNTTGMLLNPSFSGTTYASYIAARPISQPPGVLPGVVAGDIGLILGSSGTSPSVRGVVVPYPTSVSQPATTPLYDFGSQSVTTLPSNVTKIKGLFINNDGHIDTLADLSTNTVAIGQTLGDPSLGYTTLALMDGNDFFGSGTTGVIWRQLSTGTMYMWDMNGGTVLSSNNIGGSADWSITNSGDFNGDGKTDVIWRQASTGTMYMWLMDGATATASYYLSGSTDWSIVATGDFDGDGKTDLIWRQASTGATYMWLMDGGSVLQSFFLGQNTDWTVTNAADFNGDGKADLIWRQTSTGATYMWLMNGGTLLQSTFLGQNTDWSVTNTGDFDGDGKADLIWRQTSTGATYMWLMNGGTLVQSTFLGQNTDWSVTNTGDFNGDGKWDIIWRQASSGATYVWLMNGSTTTSSNYLGGSADWAVSTPQ